MLSAADAAVEGVHPGGKLRGREGLRHIVVSARHEPCDLVHFLSPGSEHDDADLLAGGPDPAANLEAVDIRQHNVQDRYADVRILCQPVHRIHTGAGLQHIVSGPP